MRVVKQLSLFLENRPGTLGEIASSLAEQEINILGFTVSDTIDHAVVRMVVSDPQKALHLLGEAGLLVVDTDVLAMDLENKPGALVELSNRLGAEGINIDYCYGTVPANDGSGMMYVRVSDITKAEKLLD